MRATGTRIQAQACARGVDTDVVVDNADNWESPLSHTVAQGFEHDTTDTPMFLLGSVTVLTKVQCSTGDATRIHPDRTTLK
jgi:hypothetical protein